MASVLIGLRDREVHFDVASNDDALSRVSTTGKKRHTVPLLDVLREVNAPRVIDYLSLDVEGMEDAVLLDFPLNEYLFLAITVERPSATLRAFLVAANYTFVHEHGWFGDQLWLHRTYPRGLSDAKDLVKRHAVEWAAWYCGRGHWQDMREYDIVCGVGGARSPKIKHKGRVAESTNSSFVARHRQTGAALARPQQSGGTTRTPLQKATWSLSGIFG